MPFGADFSTISLVHTNDNNSNLIYFMLSPSTVIRILGKSGIKKIRGRLKKTLRTEVLEKSVKRQMRKEFFKNGQTGI